VRLLTAQGIGVLLRAANHHKHAGGSLTIRGATGLVARVLELTGAVDLLCPTAPGAADAIVLERSVLGPSTASRFDASQS
jgi:anti-anti-sigma regulatory factor